MTSRAPVKRSPCGLASRWLGSGRMPRLAAILVSAAIGLGACGLTPKPARPTSLGRANDGRLVGGVPLPVRGPGFRQARPGERTRYGLPRVVAALTRAAEEVARRHPGTAPLRIGDLSYREGGRHPRHGSHRSGRDVDLVFYLTDAAGRSRRGRGWLGFDVHGVAADDRMGAGALFFFDEARNWTLVRTLLSDDAGPVQWIFVANPIKARLLAYGRLHEPDRELLLRAAWVLHQPSSGNPHADHFHVRWLCTAEERALGCRDVGPIWPWLRKAHEKPARPPGQADDDQGLLRALR